MRHSVSSEAGHAGFTDESRKVVKRQCVCRRLALLHLAGLTTLTDIAQRKCTFVTMEIAGAGAVLGLFANAFV
jgi:hypothetical protein